MKLVHFGSGSDRKRQWEDDLYIQYMKEPITSPKDRELRSSNLSALQRARMRAFDVRPTAKANYAGTPEMGQIVKRAAALNTVRETNPKDFLLAFDDEILGSRAQEIDDYERNINSPITREGDRWVSKQIIDPAGDFDRKTIQRVTNQNEFDLMYPKVQDSDYVGIRRGTNYMEKVPTVTKEVIGRRKNMSRYLDLKYRFGR